MIWNKFCLRLGGEVKCIKKQDFPLMANLRILFAQKTNLARKPPGFILVGWVGGGLFQVPLPFKKPGEESHT